MDAVEGEFANMSALDVVGENPPIWEGGPTFPTKQTYLGTYVWKEMLCSFQKMLLEELHWFWDITPVNDGM